MGDGSRPVPQVALDAIWWVAGEADRHFGRQLVRQGHRDVGATSCPGDWLYGWWVDAIARPTPVPAPDPVPVLEPVRRSVPDLRQGWLRYLERLRRRS